MNALMIRPENLPADPEKLAEISTMGSVFVDACIEKIRRLDKLGDAFGERKKLLKEGQRVGVLMFEVDKKIAELAKTLDQGRVKPNSVRDGKTGQIIKTLPGAKSETDPKWKRLGLENNNKLTMANMIQRNPDIVDYVIDKAIENNSIPRTGAVKTELKKRRKENEYAEIQKIGGVKQEMLDQLKRINTRFLNLSFDKDEYFLNKSKKIVESILKRIDDVQMLADFKEKGPTTHEEKAIKRLI